MGLVMAVGRRMQCTPRGEWGGGLEGWKPQLGQQAKFWLQVDVSGLWSEFGHVGDGGVLRILSNAWVVFVEGSADVHICLAYIAGCMQRWMC